MKLLYPTSFATLSDWAAENYIPVDEARLRFAQYGVLRAIATSRALSNVLVLKGGNALDFVWQPNRSTRDLDFSIDTRALDIPIDEDRIKRYLEPALDVSRRVLGITFRIHRIEQQPPGENRTFITYEVRIGYALPDQQPLRIRIEKGAPSTQIVPLDISINEPICADVPIDVQASNPLRVSTIEDIVAEKLRSLLQQPIRNRSRRQDLLDIAVILRNTPNLDHQKVAEFLKRKAAARHVPVSRQAFRAPEVASRAKQDYAELSQTTRTVFIPFDEALQSLYDFADTLPIPEA